MVRKGMRSVFYRSHTTLSPSSPSVSSLARTRYAAPPTYSFSESMLNETMKTAHEMAEKWNPDNSMFYRVTYLFQQENRREAKEFIKCVHELQRAMNFLLLENSNSEKLLTAQNLMQVAMKRLEKEFYQILSTNRDHLDLESISGRSSTSRTTRSRSSFSDLEDDDVASEANDIQVAGDSISKVEEVSSLAMADIKTIADCMISCGYGKECVRIYKIIRKSIVDEGLYRLGIIHLKSTQIRKMDAEILEMKIKNWLNAVKIAVRTLFNGERILSDHVFSNSETIRESCFSEVAKEGALVLFGFPKKVAKVSKKSSSSPERIFRVLDLYHNLAELWPEIESIFGFESTSTVRSKAVTSLVRLGDCVRSMISDFESTIHKDKDSSKTQIEGGAVHPLTRDVMNYLTILSDYSVPLSDIFADWPLHLHAPLPESLLGYENLEEDPPSTISVRFAWLLLVLLCKIDLKGGFYKDVPLSYLFLANNLQFVISRVQASNLRFIVGDRWISRQEAKVTQYVTNYQRIGWNKVLAALPEDPTAEINTEEVKIRFKRFRSAFETTYRKQSSWVVSDSKLRDDIKVSVGKKVIPVYKQFYEKYRGMVKDMQIKFTPDELTNYISDLFSDSSCTITSEHGAARSRGY